MARDPRLTLARPDLADIALAGQVEAARFAEPQARRVARPVAPLRRRPAFDASLDTEALLGEAVRVLDEDGEGWAFVQLVRDLYVGYLPGDALASTGAAPTHKVAAFSTFVFPGPDIKLPPLETLPFGARLAVRGVEGRFAATDRGFLFAAHLSPLDTREEDFVAVAARFLGVPYLWGGRSSFGLDCSGLVQTALAAAGIEAPRDSDQQEVALGRPIPLEGPFQRGDLLFWPGHVALVEDGATLLHANAFHMQVAREPLGPALARVAAAGAPLRGARRL